MRLGTQLITETSVTITWEECACLLCGGAYLTPLLEGPDLSTGLRFLIVRCNRCGLCFTNPRPDAYAIEQFYADGYPGHQGKMRAGKADSVSKALQSVRPARLLDFGCGAGDFLEGMRRRGWTVTGLDASPAAVARVRARGLAAHLGTLPHPLWADACFEAITMRQSLEHTHEPLAVLQAAFRLLTRGGRLVITVPNFDSFAASWFGPAWFGLDLPRHLTHFTPATLGACLHRAGFDRIEIRQERHASWIRHSAENVERQTKRNGWARILRSRLGSSFASWWAALHRRAEGIVAVATRS